MKKVIAALFIFLGALGASLAATPSIKPFVYTLKPIQTPPKTITATYRPTPIDFTPPIITRRTIPTITFPIRIKPISTITITAIPGKPALPSPTACFTPRPKPGIKVIAPVKMR